MAHRQLDARVEIRLRELLNTALGVALAWSGGRLEGDGNSLKMGGNVNGGTQVVG